MVNYLDPEGRAELTAEDLMAESGVVESELIQVNVNFIGDCHVVVEEIENSPGTTLSMYIPKGILFYLLCLEPERPWNLTRTSALEKSLRENVGWQKLIKRGMHALKKPQYE
ncbi:uncharacterized protein LOC130988005 isoform X2 [Salvia miltiorrhiza]|uniref:uncharacterized protein LOC130988005 isoform X1 n=1 Tax=Salvia miltiorrhiza TaxID=226208 RepID=UPI0025AC4B5B|nr:uncharacterized protein LOC130988005 isoform X1 [Salvia miltiorrhiza]XP_057767725.1 uncharacterized protein LOC130988005 isoform X1 [Salvia miltiorrhiza]XP_057767726.1 uncharacterized protein LOC130988005 isoform X1 [Salvia miltiorrhiza]XP_057767727.1 uncharacterized protein LOC130988005 isoform X2 [Salvia miltiorrhiza]